MHKLVVVITIAATAAAVCPAKAQTRNTVEKARIFATSPGGTIQVGNQCWRPTDQGRGYGYWTGCQQVSAFARGRVGVTISRPVIDTLEPGRVGVSLNRAALGAFARGEISPTSDQSGGGTDGGGGDGGDGGGGR